MDVVVPYAPGGPTDLAARTIGSYYEEEFDETVVVENEPGASGTMAMNELISSEPDGYTVKLIAAPATVVVPLVEDVGYTADDFDTVGVITVVPSVLAVGSDSPYESAEEFLEAAEESPGELSVGTPGANTSQSLEMQRLDEEYGVEVTTVPFEGNTEMTSALLGGNVDAIMINASEDVLANIEAGDFVPLAASPEERPDFLSDTPTFRELGYEDLTLSTSLFGFGVPNDTPEDITGKLEDTLREALEDPEVREQLGEEYIADEFIDAEEFREQLDEIVEVYEPILSE
ncbi:MAG: tripartite tricarboxylate transporter substrate binding protein [Rubrobacter sp.]|nr:tripartite tricarboxylate transporter substrate binding protein [Rubrobacter sp.]